MKKIINDANEVVQDMLDGLIAAFPNQLKLVEGTTVVARKNAPIPNKVGIISGGGSGHEPAHAGYIGKGMLDAAIAGEVFTSPTPDQVYEAIKAVDGGAGVFMVIKNYTGDMLNFEMAAELAEADGIQVAQVIVNDDVAVEDSSFTTGRRGIAGTVFVHKIAGAKAESGATLQEVQAIAEKVVNNVRSMGMALSPCTVPASGLPSFELEENEMEIGMGIHGEPGTEKKEIASANEIAEELTNKILDDMQLNSGDEVAVMINGLGSTPEMELFIVNGKVHQILSGKGIKVYETFVGEYMTSLEMAGCSVTLLKLDEELKQLLAAESLAPAFRK
ncbi:dihydroxyacetone kinase subunit DhaK [Heyndrickxia sporothermodurans]|uniref:phosphoenolpyruvate--glycerone phosphotransferase n=1 Tax=Heyndrickxia sporothermodurans TaxID=46224 RepID=A0A150LFN2_9BACI|nr:dihydroxyacetone kinase subunit DhaK [Heyndrickxia sporothermodurans]KYD11084.1 Phosphoenolpyruvate-dihydroxyacetone phosphotransferase, dihydroxyacetone binding subunit DhaK [Heyndrickxia sporothermodurans]MBL5767750.1 dihydroxyacetone kinase subunit DhaK [Heyndrickxia sporothermodurans]MBL5771256.1 dihydroxyacetone kinase subunit DhaK [Heyndrickxia sporothermodurans]MBL5776481.1 dihydroxyacetone kinase subunit DhaK [Heyndrickxia sporothermodurans]MBL5779211.1 dihydroxyacetone kinase subun